MLTTGARIEVQIEKPVAGGRMLARHEGQVVLVSGAIPGERVRARIERVSRGVAFAATLDVLDASPARRPAIDGQPTPDPLCGGNVYLHVAYAEQAAIKREVLRDALRHGGRIEWPHDLLVTPSPEQGYRMRARLHVRQGRAGFFREGTHQLCESAGTGQLLPATVDAVAAFLDSTTSALRDTIDAIEITESIAGDERVLHLVWAPRTRVSQASLAALANSATRTPVPGVTGISADNLAGGRVHLIAGQPFVSDSIAALLPDPQRGADARVQRHATSFFQANRYLVPHLVAAVHRVVGTGPVVDLYAGVGLFALTLAAAGRTAITAVEGDPSSARDLAINARPFGPDMRIVHASVEEYLAEHHTAPAAGTGPGTRANANANANASGGTDTDTGSGSNSGIGPDSARGGSDSDSDRDEDDDVPASARDTTLIVDPPRTGMSREALDGVLRAGAARLVYVSCDVATLSRDLRRIIEHGYRLDHLEAFDLFPNTAHVEALAVLSK